MFFVNKYVWNSTSLKTGTFSRKLFWPTVSNYCSSDQELQECNDVVSPTLKPDTPATSLKMTCAKSRV